ncbi:unnamed protein product [Brugia timori]|uniref:Uncharacterized protein n=1 Tax=Brugia timori TaxID=42155 RepID=A0A0R3QSK9_9BILA|nr:unnamed protein product [Brugia timori]
MMFTKFDFKILIFISNLLLLYFSKQDSKSNVHEEIAFFNSSTNAGHNSKAHHKLPKERFRVQSLNHSLCMIVLSLMLIDLEKKKDEKPETEKQMKRTTVSFCSSIPYINC